ncbi:TonB family protein [Mucilaginibacter limnophilus]|uniref:TonB family protein n=1 Tax=Mucilaginibacter limnophilus TaxID=1932778 RepID=A0A3S2ULX1_9SPHI|nr:energy transducer TonB [Mucilaginibacter limnophilus]RVU01492.1 TonB family protein [Mucilaginibacter limnophilus]
MKNLIAISFCLIISTAFAQKRDVYFYRNDGTQTELRENADYIRVVSEPDKGSVLYNVLELYTNGKKKLIGKSSSLESFTPEGTVMTFYPNGAKHTIENYKSGNLAGEMYVYFTNGKLDKVKLYPLVQKNYAADGIAAYDLITSNDSTGKSLVADKNGYYKGDDDSITYIKEIAKIKIEGSIKNGKRDGLWKGTIGDNKMSFTETYKNGELKSGCLTDADGNTYKYSKRLISPMYPGGEKFLSDFLAENIKYPAFARDRRIHGEVLVGFTVTKFGELQNMDITRSVHESIDDEALRVMRLSKNWIPGKYFGLAVDIQFNLPIDFNISFTSTSVAQGDKKRNWPDRQ